MLTIKSKLIVAYTVAFGLLVTAFAMIIHESISDAEIAKLDARLESHADKLQTELEEEHLQPGFPNRSELDSITTEGLRGTRIRLLTLGNNVVFTDSGFEIDAHVDWKSGPSGVARKGMAKWNHRKYRVLQWPVEIENRIQYLVQVAAPMHDIEETMERLRLLFFIVIPGGLLLAGCAAYFITSMAFRPMMNMVRTAEKISASNLDARLALPSADDEVRQLGKALNDMIERIDNTFKGQRQFVADASHELRTPLTIIRSELESAARAARSRGVKESLSASLAELDRMSVMIGDLLVLAKLDAARMKLETAAVRLDELVIECVQTARGIAKKRDVKLKVFIGDAAEVSGDHEKLKSVILNLLDNAIKYSGKKSSVTVSLILNQTPGMASIVISDHGIGIPESEQAKVFRRFYRGAKPRSTTDGSGLGLAISQRFVALHGGSISVKSQEGKGSTFTVELPLGGSPA
ncbi:MAG: HAMP domain-containing sensor histidine kinase [Ignavibacteriales bacterium]|nr:HAMP domain-containing sensor histidine kinase [Ignavibacteriales bacterium]